MLEFFRKYQRSFFAVITTVVISSFIFFGTFNTFAEPERNVDRSIGKKIDGSSLMLSEVQRLARFIATDREDAVQGRGLAPNLCNDGVIRHDLVKEGLAQLVVSEYFDAVKGELEGRLEKARRFKPYAHPEASFLSAKTVWDHFIPELNGAVEGLQKEAAVTPAVFGKLAKIYQLQHRLQPDVLRQILIYQHRQYPWLTVDQKLSYEDLSLFGFHSAADWFGHNFVDLSAEFILNAAAAAEEKGYRVSLEEAKGDLIRNFQDSVEKMGQGAPALNFHNHLRMLGFDERTASEVWRKVLLFRKYFQDVGSAAFVDRLPYKDFAEYAKEEAVVQAYRWPVAIRSAQDLSEWQFYVKAVSGKEGLPTAILPVDEVEKKFPELVSTTYKAKVAEVSKKELALKPSVKQVWDWETDEANWPLVKKQFSLAEAKSPEERFRILERFEKRSEVDQWAREKLVDQHPEWIEEALAAAPLKEKTWSVSGKEEPNLKKEGIHYRIEELEKVKEKHILTFTEARDRLSKLAPKGEGDFYKEKNPFALATKEALAALKKNPSDPRWVKVGEDPLLDQFRLEKKEQSVLRTSKEDWMREQAFLLLPDVWSPIHVADNGDIVFFYLQEKKSHPTPILDQLSFGKETLAADAKTYVAERLLQVVKQKQAIVIPIQQEDQ